MRKRWVKLISHRWNVLLWEREIRLVTNHIAKIEGIQKGTYAYNFLLGQVANNEIVQVNDTVEL